MCYQLRDCISDAMNETPGSFLAALLGLQNENVQELRGGGEVEGGWLKKPWLYELGKVFDTVEGDGRGKGGEVLGGLRCSSQGCNETLRCPPLSQS